jgi:hypothetical protein
MNIYPDWLLLEVSGGGGGTIIVNGLGVDVDQELTVLLEGELEAIVEIEMPVPVDAGLLAVSLEGDLSIELEACPS